MLKIKLIKPLWLAIASAISFYALIPVAALAAPAGLSDWTAIPPITSVKQLENGAELRGGGVVLRVIAVQESVVRVRATRVGQLSDDRSSSWAVVQRPSQVKIKNFVQDAARVQFDLPSFRVRIEKSPVAIRFLDFQDQVINQDDAKFPMAFNGEEFRIWKSMPADEHYFGLGDKAGPIDHRNQAFTMWNTDAFGWQESTDPLYKTIPFFLALRGGKAYGIFLDNTYWSSFDFGKASRQRYSFGASGGELDYYFFYGPGPKKVIEDYTALTGRMPLPPRFALGYQQSRYSYYPEARVREIADQFRARKIPCDVIYLDIDYQEKNRPFTVSAEKFPHFQQMVRDLAQQGFKLVLITDLHIAKLPGYTPYDQGLAGDDFVKNPDGSVYVGQVWPGESVFPDFTLARARQWWGTLYQPFVADGVRGFWNDMNEPAIFRADKTMPLDVRHRMDNGEVADHRAIHNVYGMENARATYDGLLQLQPNVRPFVLTRAAYAGAQRYAASWTGDNSSTWNHLRISVPTLLSLGISGYAFVGADVGGFNGSPTPELLTRWLELGTFYPVDRDHTMKGSADQEPWAHDPEQEAIRRRFIELRYQMLPYIYTSVEETARTGLPIMRPMFLEFPDDPALATNSEEFMFGHDLLVAPRLTEMVGPYMARLPAGTWFNYWTGQQVEGGSEIAVDPRLDEVPLYVRSGAIIPQQPVVQNTAETPPGPLELRVYPGPDCHGSIYWDDGESLAYSRGQVYRREFSCAITSGGVEVELAAPQGPFVPWWKSIQVDVYGVGTKPTTVLMNEKPVQNWSYDAAQNRLEFLVPESARPTDLRLIP